ncbi:hypothetical protein F2S72_09045 [Pseudomonas syringae pv. actinidiae]|nr:hypothetical protein [Pseudomonas syringae pv. actinidiae]
MTHMLFDEVFQDEAYALKFIIENPWHAVVLGRIAATLEKYQSAYSSALENGNLGLMREIGHTTSFLKYEACDRVNICLEYRIVDGFEALFGKDAVQHLLNFQQQFIDDNQGAEWAAVPYCHELELEYAEAGLGRVLSWGIESGKGNIRQLTRIRQARHHLFHLTREMHQADLKEDRKRAYLLRERCTYARKLIGPLAIIECRSKALSAIKEIYGNDESRRVLTWVKENTRLREYEAQRDAMKSFTFTSLTPCDFVQVIEETGRGDLSDAKVDPAHRRKKARA